MIQDLLTYLLIASATAYILFRLYRMIYPSDKGRAGGCAGCSGCSHDIDPGKTHAETGFKPIPASVPNKDIVKISQDRSYSSDSGSVPGAGEDTRWVQKGFASADLEDRMQ